MRPLTFTEVKAKGAPFALVQIQFSISRKFIKFVILDGSEEPPFCVLPWDSRYDVKDRNEARGLICGDVCEAALNDGIADEKTTLNIVPLDDPSEWIADKESSN